MNAAVGGLIGVVLAVGLSGCAGVPAGATLHPLALGATVYCPPSYTKPCGTVQPQGHSGGKTIYDLLFVGQKAIYASLGDTFTATFPPSDSKFFINDLLITNFASMQGLSGHTLTFRLVKSGVDPQGNYTFTYENP